MIRLREVVDALFMLIDLVKLAFPVLVILLALALLLLLLDVVLCTELTLSSVLDRLAFIRRVAEFIRV